LTYAINSLGIRDREIPEGTRGYRILFLGDSQTWGEGLPVENRFSDLIGMRFPGVVTMNAGVPGYGIHQMLGWYQHYGRALRPDLVLLCMMEGDILRAAFARIRAEPRNVLTAAPASGSPAGSRTVYALLNSGWRRFMNRHVYPHLRWSWLYSYVRVKTEILRMSHILAERDRLAFDKEAAREQEAERSKGLQGASEYKENLFDAVTLDVMATLQQACSEQGAGLIVVNIDDHPVPRLERILPPVGIKYVDISPHLARTSRYRFSIDPHYNQRGHRVIAQALAAELRGMLPALPRDEK
jgi:lysophospholipase L1-like esterase